MPPKAKRAPRASERKVAAPKKQAAPKQAAPKKPAAPRASPARQAPQMAAAPRQAPTATRGFRAGKAPGARPAKRTGAPAPDAESVVERDAPVADSGADMEGEAPERERHGDDTTVNPQGRAAAGAKHLEEAEHMHRDPRWTEPKLADKWKKAKRDPRKEGGLSKDRQVRRLEGMTNWFRRAPKSKQS